MQAESTLAKQIGSRLREARIKKGLSQAELAFQANMATNHISNIELGKQRLLIDSFVKIIEILQVSADSILRPDTPNTKEIYIKELSDLLQDCTPAEMETIFKICKELKNTLHKKEEK